MPAARSVLVALVAAVLAVGCTGGDVDGSDATEAPTAAGTATATRTPTTDPSPVPTTTPSPTSGVEDVAFGTGTVTVDGTELPVSGDCDVSRAFGEERVTGLDDAVDVLLAVDNVTAAGVPTGSFGVRVRLLGNGAVEGRTITSRGAPGDDGTMVDVTYEGEVTVAELHDRRELEFLDVATLHLEATQQRVAGNAGPASRELVVDVTCPIARPS